MLVCVNSLLCWFFVLVSVSNKYIYFQNIHLKITIMKKSVLLLVLLLAFFSVNAQFVKNLKEFTTESGFVIEKGLKIKILDGVKNHKGQAMWTYYGMKKIPAPKTHFNKEQIGKVFVIEKVVKLRGVSDDELSTLIVFYDGKKKCYSHIVKALETEEVEFLD